MKRTYEEIENEIIELLENDDDIFCECVNELDSYNGFADGYRCYDMSEIDDFYCDAPASKLLEDLTENFCKNDNYFYFSIYGLESCDDMADLYRDNTTTQDVLATIIENSSCLSLDYELEELEELLEELEECENEEDEDEDEDEEEEE